MRFVLPRRLLLTGHEAAPFSEQSALMSKIGLPAAWPKLAFCAITADPKMSFLGLITLRN